MSQPRGPHEIVLAVSLLLASGPSLLAQTVVDGSDAAIGPEGTRTVLALIDRRLHSPDAKVTGLRQGRAGAVCGAVDVKNRMGTYTGPRNFVVDPTGGFVGLLPDGPEVRNPASAADSHAMENARVIFERNCTR